MKTALEGIFGLGGSPGGTPDGSSRSVRKAIGLCHSLLTQRGEVSGVKIANETLDIYRAMDEDSRSEFFTALSRNFSPDPEAVGLAGEAYSLDPSAQNLARLRDVAEPPRQELFRRLNTAPGATRTLVDLRGEIFAGLSTHPQWEPVAADMGHLFTSWFNRGFLVMRQINWDSPASILEKIIRYEAVHEIHGFSDLRRRLAADRRCYAFFHPALPDDPIIFIEVALTRGMSAKVQPLLELNAPVTDPARADSAIFYSITNCLDGLRGVPLGSFLIKQVVENLSVSFPNLRRFATLSPVPGFAAWLQKHPRYPALQEQLSQPDWFEDRAIAASLATTLVPLCAQYLLAAKSRQEPLDPVARFHLRNGAELDRINWLGDTSAAGMQRSFGLMVNYVYRLAEIEQNHELYTEKFKVAASTSIESIFKNSRSNGLKRID
jgi:malonyl-CoA decarboxylase